MKLTKRQSQNIHQLIHEKVEAILNNRRKKSLSENLDVQHINSEVLKNAVRYQLDLDISVQCHELFEDLKKATFDAIDDEILKNNIESSLSKGDILDYYENNDDFEDEQTTISAIEELLKKFVDSLCEKSVMIIDANTSSM